MTAYLSYLMGDVLGFSGILSLFVSAVAISHYALHNISAESRTTTIYSFQVRAGQLRMQGGKKEGVWGACAVFLLLPPLAAAAACPSRLALPARACPCCNANAASARCVSPAVRAVCLHLSLLQTLSYISEGIIFVYCGLDALDPLKWKVGAMHTMR